MKKIIIPISILLMLIVTSCKRENTLNTTKITAHQKSDLLDRLTRRLDSLSDTSSIDPKKLPDVITYSTAKNGPTIAEQRAFIRASGFSVVDEPSLNTRSKQRMLLGASQVTDSFDKADASYKSYIAQQSKNQSLTVFKQNAASVIIRQYLLGDKSQNNHLQYYTEELLQSHSQNYGLLYLAIQQLKGYVSTQRLGQYKNMINTDPVVANRNRQMEAIQQGIKTKYASFTERQLKLVNVLLKGSEMSRLRDQYLINKIKGI
ncbi:MAG: hypothetical protein JWP94_1218 [Mucilaginibacter sp.]|jgi:hypothetical protein|nr:hypothetical protein [Mucilaginibacter sp.]